MSEPRHPHSHRHEHPLPPSGQGTVVLDIGGDVGALVVHATGELSGVEIELAASCERTQGSCTRRCANGAARRGVYAGVFTGRRRGQYTLVGVGGRADTNVTIGNGSVTGVGLGGELGATARGVTVGEARRAWSQASAPSAGSAVVDVV